jgi:two-component system, chemotaxis family, chemotaxis protein CheY
VENASADDGRGFRLASESVSSTLDSVSLGAVDDAGRDPFETKTVSRERFTEERSMKILIVDDSKAMRMIVMRTLRQAGFGDHEFIEAGNGSEGLQKVKSENPGLVLSDWNMPVMSGIEFLRALRAEGNQTKFGFVTSEGTQETRDLALGEGALFLVTKPFTPESFQEAIGAHVS